MTLTFSLNIYTSIFSSPYNFQNISAHVELFIDKSNFLIFISFFKINIDKNCFAQDPKIEYEVPSKLLLLVKIKKRVERLLLQII